MDRLAVSPLRLPVNEAKWQKKTKKTKGLKYRMPDEDAGLSKTSRKRRLAPLSTIRQQSTALPPSEKARKEFELALQRRDFEQVLWLIENGDIPATYETHGGETALLAAIGAKHEDAFRLIMQCGVSIDTRNRHGYTPLMKAIAGAAPFAEATLSSDVKKPINTKSVRPSLVVIDTERTSNNTVEETFDNTMVTRVLAHRPDLHAKDAFGHIAFDWAVRTRNIEAQTLLTDHQNRLRSEHADFAGRDSRQTECLVLLQRHDALAMEMEALLRRPLVPEDALQRLIRECAANAPRDKWLNALQDFAVLCTPTDVLFLDAYVLERETRDGWTPLIKAGAGGCTAAVQLLLTYGVNVNSESSRLKHTALTWSCVSGHDDTVLALLRVPELDVNLPTREGKTALIHAVANRQLAIVRNLLRAMHESSVRKAGAKVAFHVFETRQDRPRSRWGQRPVSVGLARGKYEWHEVFLEMIRWQDSTGRDALGHVSHDQEDDIAKAIEQELQQAIDQAHEHATYVATHQERTMPTPCKYSIDGCDFIAPRDLLPSHELHACTKRRVPCEQCGLEIKADDLDVHKHVQCDGRLIPCANGCAQCIAVCDIDAHLRDHCRKRPVRCRLGCDQDDELTYDQREVHETSQCGRRLIGCPLGCGIAPFPANERVRHQRDDCVKRLVKCTGCRTRTGGCGMMVCMDAMDLHVTTLCVARRMACKWAGHGCAVRIGGSIESRSHHEDIECPFRFVSCKHAACGHSKLLACFLDEHYAWQCSVEPIECPHTCGVAPMARHLMDAHTLSDAGDCRQRPIHCRLDLCGKMLRLYDPGPTITTFVLSSDVVIQPDARASLRALRQRLARATAFLDKLQQHHTMSTDEAEPDEKVPVYFRVDATRTMLLTWLEPLHAQLQIETSRLEEAKQNASVRVRVLSFDVETSRHLVEFQRDGHAEWLDLRGREYDVELPSATSADPTVAALSFRCGMIPASDADAHEQEECSLRLVPCPLACGQRLAAQAVAPHLGKRCNLRNATCRLGCGAVLPFVSLSDHELSQCDRRQVSCDHCHATLPHRALATHLATQCDQVPRRCRFGCGAMIPSAQFTSHEATICPKRLVPCAQCNQSVWFCELESHATQECPLRSFGLCDAGCGLTLRVNKRTHHLLFDCHMRQLPCPLCHTVVTWRDLAQHKTLLCPLRDVACRRGCGQIVREMEVAAHEETDCVRRLVYCPNRCGTHLVSALCHEHLTLQCSLRVVPCPQGCGDQLFAYQCESHVVRCRQRLVRCGAGSTNCARPLRLWVHSRRLVSCKTHGENGLLWAIKSLDDDLVAYFVQAVNDDQLDVEFANGFTPLSTAVSLGRIEILKTLLRAGADVNSETSRGRTPLREAVLARNPEIVALLLEHRASVTHVNRHGQSIVALAENLVTADATDADAARVLALLQAQFALETDHRELFRAIACSDYAHVASLLQYSSGVICSNPTTLQNLELQVEEAQSAFDVVAQEVHETVSLLNESIADTEAKTTHAQRVRERVDDCHAQIEAVAASHEASLAASQVLEAELLAQIRSITALDIAALLNAATPTPESLVVMKSICMLCGVMPRGRRQASEYTDMEWWKTAQALLMDRTLLSRLRGYRNQTITPDVMAKVRRECLRTEAFAATTRALVLDETTKAQDEVSAAHERVVHRRGAVTGGLVARLAVWVQGVEREYKHQNARATLQDKSRRLAISLDAHTTAHVTASFEMQVATRSLPARQHEVELAQAKLATSQRSLTSATQRLRAYRLVQLAASNGHTALSFASAVGNEAMVHLLLTHGASAGPVADDREASAALIQLTFRAARDRRRRAQLDVVASRSDAAAAALVRSVAQQFLVGHYQRKRRYARLTHRVALHEAVYNGHVAVADLLLAHGATLWHPTHVFPQRTTPGSIDRVRGDAASELALRRRGGWCLVPLTETRGAESETDPVAIETRLAPLTIDETLCHAIHRYDSSLFTNGWRRDETRYNAIQAFITQRLTQHQETQATQRREILARKAIHKKTTERERLHAQLDVAIVAKDMNRIAELLDAGAFADYETKATGLTALSAACADEMLFVTNQDGVVVRAMAFLLDRVTNRPNVDYESTTGTTALSIAARWNATLCAQELIGRGVNLNYATRTTGETALMVAARQDHVEFVAFLLRHPLTNVFCKDLHGKTALDYATGHECRRLVAAAMGGHRALNALIASTSALDGVCRWGCGYITPTRASTSDDVSCPLTVHETEACPKRIVQCPLGCPEPTLWAERITSHTKEDCPRRLVPCSQAKCIAPVQAQDLPMHERETCEWRMVLCECGERMAYTKYVRHAATSCPQRFVSCPNNCLDTATGAVLQLRACDLKQHERTECPYRRVRCRHGCPASMLANDRDHHETHTCPLRRVECQWHCQETNILAHTRYHHETEECLQRELACPLKCGESIQFLDLDTHTTLHCAHRLVHCALGCTRKVPLHTMDRHVTNECPCRIVSCSHGCGISMRERELATHLSTQCPLRLTTCSLCGISGIVQTDLVMHREASCRMRIVQCRFQCYTTQPLRAFAQQQHEEFECPLRPVYCPLGCGDIMMAHMTKQHEKGCSMRIVTCGRGCGVELREKERLEHEQRYCAALKMATLPHQKL